MLLFELYIVFTPTNPLEGRKTVKWGPEWKPSAGVVLPALEVEPELYGVYNTTQGKLTIQGIDGDNIYFRNEAGQNNKSTKANFLAKNPKFVSA